MTRTSLLVASALVVGMTAVPVPASAESIDLTAGLVAHWSFDEPSGTAIVDSSGNRHDGTIYGATRSAGVSGTALDFDGSAEAWVPGMDETPPPGITGLTQGSISLWVMYRSAESDAEPFFYLGDPLGDGDKDGFIIEAGHPGNDHLYFTFFDDEEDRPALCFDTSFDLVPGRWYHFVGVVGPDFNTGYVDGVELVDRHYTVGSPKRSVFFSSIDDAARLTFGSGYYHQSEILNLDGMLDEVRIYDRALTAEEVTALYAGTEPPENRAPLAVADSASTAVGTPVVVDVLANDVDPDGDPLEIASVTAPASGEAAIEGSVVVYTPDAGFVGFDTFSYTVVDPSGATGSAAVTVDVTEPGSHPDPPSAPEGLTATAIAGTGIRIEWVDTSSGAAQETQVEVQRSDRTEGTQWLTIAAVGPDVESYVDGTVVGGHRYAYRVRAINDAGASRWSNRAAATA